MHEYTTVIKPRIQVSAQCLHAKLHKKLQFGPNAINRNCFILFLTQCIVILTAAFITVVYLVLLLILFNICNASSLNFIRIKYSLDQGKCLKLLVYVTFY